MSNNEHREARDAHRAFRCTFGPVREKDLVWPPPEADLDAFSVVHTGDGVRPGPAHGEAGVTSDPAPLVEVAPVPAVRPLLKPTFGDCRDPGVAPRIRPLVFPMEPPPLPAAAAGDGAPDELAAVVAAAAPFDGPPPLAGTASPDEPMVFPVVIEAAARDPELGGSRSAWLAVFLAAACAIVTVVQYRAIFSLPAEIGAAAGEQPPAPDGVSAADLAPGVAYVPPAARPSQATVRNAGAPAPSSAKPDRRIAEPLRPEPDRAEPLPRAAATLVRPRQETVPRVTPALSVPAGADSSRLAANAPGRTVSTPEPPAPRVEVAVLDGGVVPQKPMPSPAPASIAAPAPATARAVRPEPTATASPASAPRPVASSLAAAIDDDETDIRSTLTRFRTAYSQLDARAARAVWPSVDARALERAFQSLKSQELRFERCSLTVTGARAQAACKGRAIYVPRIGDQSPRYTAREWTFELRKADEQWTIASARTL